MSKRADVPDWLRRAVFYQVYPQSFHDSNGDGIGDLGGLEQKLDYIKSLGVTAIWINPCFESPFRDAGYDISDFCKVAPRYGSNADLRRLIGKAHRMGLRVCLDLVPGHASIDHPWFKDSCRHKPNKHSNWFVWTHDWWAGMGKANFVNGYDERNGSFMCNFFWHQPKLNYGFNKPDPTAVWQLPMDHPDVLALRAEMRKVIRYWLDMGADGYRIDSAKSIVIGDPREGTAAWYRELRQMLERDYPEAVLIAEWGWPVDSLKTGLHADFLLHNMTAYKGLFHHSAWRGGKESFFQTDGGDIGPFIEQFMQHYVPTRGRGYISIPTSNHDCRRIADGRSDDEMELVFAFLLTMPGPPTVYYGEEIGMKFVPGLPSKEGGYARTGSRTPMQWTPGRNAGFSAAPARKLYLPVARDAASRNVAEQDRQADSLLNRFRRLAALRSEYEVLQADAEFEPLYAKSGKLPFVYQRKLGRRRVIVALNPRSEPARVRLKIDAKRAQMLAGRGAELAGSDKIADIRMSGVSFGIWSV